MKKILNQDGSAETPGQRRTERICLTVAWVTLILLFMPGLMYSQQGSTFSFNLTDVTIEGILRNIEEQSAYRFIYSQELVDVQRKVDLVTENQTLPSLLDELFNSTDIHYTIKDNQVVLTHMVDQPEEAKGASRLITGRILDVNGDPLPGVNVLEKGTFQGTISNMEGRFSLTLEKEDPVLQFSYIGYRTQEILPGDRTDIEISMQEKYEELDEIIVVGYGTRKKSDLTGSVASMNKDRLANLPSANILESMQGAVAGVTITKSNAKPGAEPDIYIRGINSITADNSPLVVVDGIPGTGLGNINQNDIESIEILKDASASAIYGARGANGVILVTTKRGKGKPTVSYNGYEGVQQISNKMNLMDGATHIKNKIRAYELGGFPSDTSDIYTIEEYNNILRGEETDWQDVYLRKGRIAEHQFSVSSGLENTNYYLSVSRTNHEHILQNYDYIRTGVRFNLDQKIGKWLNIGNSMNVAQTVQTGIAGNLKYATWMTPWNNPYDENGDLIMFPANNNFIGNPIAERNTVVNNTSYQIFNNLFGIVRLPVKGLSYRLNLGVDIRTAKNNKYQGRDTPLGFNADGIADISTNNVKNWVIENILNYENTFAGVHNVKFTGLYSAQEFYRETSSVNAYGFPTDQIVFNNISAAETFNAPASSATKSNYLSYMARLTYNYNLRYYVTGTVRKDGFSAFGDNKKFGTFPSLALSWRISEEAFMQNIEVLNLLKFRISYGKNGNQAVNAYSSIANVITGNPDEPENGGNSYAYIFGQDILYGYLLAKLGNEDLGWETTKSLNLGIDYGFFAGRLTGSVEYYNANTSDLLLDRGISWVNGFSEVRSNIGETHNHGVDITLNSFNIDRGPGRLQWRTTVNYSYNHNEIVELYGDQKDDVGNNWFINEPIDVIFDYVFDGIVQDEEDMSGTAQPDAEPGEIKVRDMNGNGVIDPDDRRIVGVRRPDMIFGLNSVLSYRGFELSLFIQGTHGITKQNSLLENGVGAGTNNLDIEWWTPETPSNRYPTLKQGKKTTYWSAFQYESADYIRLRDISLAYNFPVKMLRKIRIQRLRVYVSGRNLLTYTKWQGLDPETGSFNNPNTKSVVVGLNVSL